MLVSEFTHRTSSPHKNKENTHPTHEYEHLKSIVSRNEQLIISMRKQLSQKVNKTQFLSALSSKVSLSDITNLTSSSFHQEQDSSMLTIRQSMEQQVKTVMKSFQQSKDESIQEIKKEINLYRSQLQSLQQNLMKKEGDFWKELRDNDHSMMQSLERKVERSEFDKMMHLSSLLAIEFQLIKKRFGTFEVDYNLIWKEISNLYTNHQTLRSVFNTERKSSIENTKQKQGLTKTGNNCKGRLFKEETGTYDSNQTDQAIVHINQKMELLDHQQNDHQYSINNFGERLAIIERDYENWMGSMKEIAKLKKQYNESKSQIVMLQDKSRQMRQQMSGLVKVRCEAGIRQVNRQISHQIKQACEEISDKMLHLFAECAKINETQVLRNNIAILEEQMEQKMNSIMDQTKKRLQTLANKNELVQDKVRLLTKEVGCRVRAQELDQVKQTYLTSQTALAILKKSQGALKKEITQFKDSQSMINEVVCSQTILARWIWISGQLRGGNLISWDKETVNTLPQNFIYNKPEMNFKVMSGGIYKVQMGFYAKKRPNIQVIINGKTIVSAVNTNSYVVHHSSGKLKDITNSQIAGLTYYDYFTLPQNTRLAISYTGEVGHGFFGIQRL